MHVILALDGSNESLAATRTLARLPWAEKPQVTVVTALVESPYDLVPTDTGVRLRKAEQENAIKAFESAKRILEPHCASVEHVVDRQHPRKLILESAKRHNADLIVLGARGHSAAYRVVLGSVSDYIANHAKCSVLAVRESSSESTDTANGFQLLVACDGSEESREAFRQMSSFAWPKGETRLHLTMMLEKPKLLPEDAVYDPDQLAESEQMLTDLQGSNSICDDIVQSVRETPHIGSAIRHLAATDDIDLLFIGGTGKSAVARFFLGSTSRYVLHHSDCNIWIARTKQWNELQTHASGQ